VGFGPIAWLLISELFPNYVRTQAVSIAVVTNFSTNLVITLLFPTEIDLIGGAFTFFIFAVIDLYALFFIRKHVPETKGMTLEQIQQQFASK